MSSKGERWHQADAKDKGYPDQPEQQPEGERSVMAQAVLNADAEVQRLTREVERLSAEVNTQVDRAAAIALLKERAEAEHQRVLEALRHGVAMTRPWTPIHKHLLAALSPPPDTVEQEVYDAEHGIGPRPPDTEQPRCETCGGHGITAAEFGPSRTVQPCPDCTPEGR